MSAPERNERKSVSAPGLSETERVSVSQILSVVLCFERVEPFAFNDWTLNSIARVEYGSKWGPGFKRKPIDAYLDTNASKEKAHVII